MFLLTPFKKKKNRSSSSSKLETVSHVMPIVKNREEQIHLRPHLIDRSALGWLSLLQSSGPSTGNITTVIQSRLPHFNELN